MTPIESAGFILTRSCLTPLGSHATSSPDLLGSDFLCWHDTRHRHAASAKARKGRIGVLAPDGLAALRDQANELGAHYFDVTHMRSFNKNRKTIKKWGKCVMPQLNTPWLAFF